MRGNGRLVPKAGTLLHAKAVLLINYSQAEVLEHYNLFYKGVCSNQYLNLPRG